jgi:REP element-mobilizing transposase RayT
VRPRGARERHPFHIDAFVVLPDHIHAIWTLPEGEHGLVTCVRDWPFSSFHRDVAAGLFPQDWAGEIETLGEFGEREWRNKAIAPYD